MTLLYNLLMAAADVAGLGILSTRRIVSWASAVAVGHAALGIGLARLLREGHFGFPRLLAWGLFFHGTALLAGSSLLMWRSRRLWAIGSAVAALLLLAIAADAFLIEPTWLEVSHLRIVSAKVRRPTRIVVMADIQTDGIGDYERQVFRRAIEEKPDIVIFAGDYIQCFQSAYDGLADQFRLLAQELQQETAAHVFAVRGNIDPHPWDQLFGDSNVMVAGKTEGRESCGLWITCLSLNDSRDRSLDVARPAGGDFHIVVGHVPNFALGRVDADLLIAGHTHGGQIRLPWLGPVVTHSAIPRRWAAGTTPLASGALLVVSRGIGMERENAPRFRFLCRPELVVIDITPSGDP